MRTKSTLSDSAGNKLGLAEPRNLQADNLDLDRGDRRKNCKEPRQSKKRRVEIAP